MIGSWTSCCSKTERAYVSCKGRLKADRADDGWACRQARRDGDWIIQAALLCGGARSRSLAAEIRSTICIGPPHLGQSQSDCGRTAEPAVAAAVLAAEACSGCRQRGSRVARQRLARKPKLRIRTKARDSTCSRKRRSNLWEARVIGLVLLPCAESRQRKVTLPSSRARSLELEMATRWV